MAENTLQSIVSRLVTDPDFEKTFSLDQFFSTNKEAIIKNVSANPNNSILPSDNSLFHCISIVSCPLPIN